jgi:hypothetical protein
LLGVYLGSIIAEAVSGVHSRPAGLSFADCANADGLRIAWNESAAPGFAEL